VKTFFFSLLEEMRIRDGVEGIVERDTLCCWFCDVRDSVVGRLWVRLWIEKDWTKAPSILLFIYMRFCLMVDNEDLS